jgi:hypothetical protein
VGFCAFGHHLFCAPTAIAGHGHGQRFDARTSHIVVVLAFWPLTVNLAVPGGSVADIDLGGSDEPAAAPPIAKPAAEVAIDL